MGWRTGSRHGNVARRRLIWRVAPVLAAALAAIGVFSGLSGLLPIGREVTAEGGVARTSIVLNPETGLSAWSDCDLGTLKITTSVFSVVYVEPSRTASVAGVVQRGDIVSVKGKNGEGWWFVYLPGGCAATAWAPPETFQTIKLDLPQDASATNGATPPAPPPPPPAPAPASPGGSGVSGSGTIVVSSSLSAVMITVAGADGMGVVGDEGNRFTVAVETNLGSIFEVRLSLGNASGRPLIGQLDLNLPAGVRASAARADQVSGIGQVGPGSWKFTMAAGAANLAPDIILTFRVASDAPPGFGSLTGTIRQVAS